MAQRAALSTKPWSSIAGTAEGGAGTAESIAGTAELGAGAAGSGGGAKVVGFADAATREGTVFGWAGTDCTGAASSSAECSISSTMTRVAIDANTMM
ncbi:MAG: hypothetical protein ACPGVY_15155, partial [Mycobacterium sp.]